MRSLKVLAIALVAVGCSMLSAPKASADTILMSSPSLDVMPTSTVIDTSVTEPMVISQPAVVETTPVVSTPVVTSPTIIERPDHLLNVGLPGLLNFSLF